MPAQTNNLFVLQDLEDSSKTANLAARDLSALRTVANWIESFVARPAKDLGRPGSVCPFVPHAVERKTLWLAPERTANHRAADMVPLIDGYKRLLLSAKPSDSDDAQYQRSSSFSATCRRIVQRTSWATSGYRISSGASTRKMES